ncbi:hypothetical protein TrVFT333_008763 [Trichoderma virens FT-333]|nr:hypothetical protein TrVFT333_008763 [Trichoderma virens FT-333]
MTKQNVPYSALEKYDLKASSHDQICEGKSCTKPGFSGSRFCKDHLSAWRDLNPLETDLPQLQKLREHVSPFLQVKWSNEPAIGKVLALMDSIGAGKSLASALRFVDLEYNIFTGRVFEIGMTAKQIADELRRQGISQETYFVVWHLHTDDLSRLREWLENLRGAKLPDGKRFPLTLSTIFPIMMGTNHVLAGKNHHALVDAQQLQCMMAIFRVLCLSPQNRPDGWLKQLRQDPSSHRAGLRQAMLESFWKGS